MRRRLLRQHQQMDRRAGQKMEGGIDQQGAAPAHCDIERAGQRPEDRRGEAADDGQHADCPPRARSGDLGESDAGGRAERQGRGDAQARPAQQIAHHALREGECCERQGIDDRARRHHGARAGAIDHPADARREDRAHGEHYRDATEHDLARDAEVVTDVAAQHRGHQEGGAPAHDPGEAEAGGRQIRGSRCGRDPHAARDRSG